MLIQPHVPEGWHPSGCVPKNLPAGKPQPKVSCHAETCGTTSVKPTVRRHFIPQMPFKSIEYFVIAGAVGDKSCLQLSLRKAMMTEAIVRGLASLPNAQPWKLTKILESLVEILSRGELCGFCFHEKIRKSQLFVLHG